MRQTLLAALFFLGLSQFGSASDPRYTIKLRRLPDFIVAIPVTVNGSGPFWCALDTGGSRELMLDATPSARAGLRPNTSGSSAGEGPRVVSDRRSTGVTLSVGSLQIPNRTVIIGSPEQEDPNSQFVCIFGTAILGQFVLEIDFQTHALRIYNPDGFKPGRGAVEIPVGVDSGKFLIPVHLALQSGEVVDAKLLVDTGVPLWPLALSRRFSDDHRILKRVRTITEPPFQGEATGGSIGLLATRAKDLRVGPFQVEEPIIILFRSASGRQLPWDGNLGAEFCRRFTLTLDSPNRRLYMQANKDYDLPPSPYDGSGLWIRGAPGHWSVARVLPDSPAAFAGLVKGDSVLSLDGIPASELTLPRIRGKLYRSHGICNIKVRHGDTDRMSRLVLKSYL